MDDIVPGLLEVITQQFDERTYNSKKLKAALKSFQAKKATYKDVNEFAIEVGEILADVLQVNITAEILPDGKMYFNIADRILNPTLQKNFDLISGYAIDVQRQLNHDAGLHLKAQAPEFNQDRVDGFINRISSEDDFDSIKWILDDPIVNFCQNVVDDTIRANVEFHAKAGLGPKITRTVSGHKPCKWCKALAGTYDYDDFGLPDDIFHRHENCHCIVEYLPGDGKRQDVWSKAWRDPQKDAKIKARKSIGIKTDKENAEVHLQNHLDFVDPITHEKSFIPTNATIENARTIFQGKNIRIVNRLVDTYGGRLPNWKKRVGKIESERYVHDVHWYENNNKQYEAKVKFRKEKDK